MAVKPDRFLLLIAFVGFVSLGLPDAVIGVAWPSVREHFALQQRDVGLVFVGSGCGYFLSSAFAGRLILSWGVGVLLAASTALVAASALGFAAAPLWYAFAACAVFHGVGSGAIDAGLNNFVAHNFSAKQGAAVLPAGTGLVANAFGLYWVGLIALTIAGVLFVMHELLLFRDRNQ